MRYIIFSILPFLLLISCSSNSAQVLEERVHSEHQGRSDRLLKDRFEANEGYTTTNSESNSFGYYLQHLPLHPPAYKVHYFNRDIKTNRNVYCAGVNMDIDEQDLQQCADAVMRLRAEYLYEQKRYSDIKFNFLSDGKPRYYTAYAKGDYSYPTFRKYMRYIFSYANTRSLHDELESINWSEMQIGDVFIQKGNPYGHAVIVVNMASNIQGNKQYMLAQSYMPAQETQILVNPKNSTAWYTLKEGNINTPEWIFHSSDLRHF